jgi:NTP pyrophosphatase (non-canonical NTP hydrolase)
MGEVSMIENQKTISEWAEKTFGYVAPERSISRMLEEVEELKNINLSNEKSSFNEVSNECADIFITMCQIASTWGFNLQACVDHKMQINRARKWKIAGDGTGRHIDE